MTVDKSPRRIRQMFGEIARRYDLLNHLLSAGMDRWWRRRTVRLAPPNGEGAVLDVCTGTADLALAYWRAGRGRVRVVGADFCRPMLALGRRKRHRAKATNLTLVEADAQQLPFADNVFQVVSVAFGLRNLSDPDLGLREMTRVCRPGGRVAVLEFGMPRTRVLRGLYGWYFRGVLPRLGQALARNRQEAYNYLPASVGEFPQRDALVARMRQAGLCEVRYHPLTFGIAGLYVGTK
jgi:demethylmenaquinone methyltransferase/2-methoxy-6-polyprenyl-1,4-benzoquinol methylase